MFDAKERKMLGSYLLSRDDLCNLFTKTEGINHCQLSSTCACVLKFPWKRMLLTQQVMAASSAEGESGAHSGVSDSIVTEFSTYEDFLDSQITPTDLYYLEVSSCSELMFVLIGAHYVRMKSWLASLWSLVTVEAGRF